MKRKAIVFYFEQRARIVLPDITRLRPREAETGVSRRRRGDCVAGIAYPRHAEVGERSSIGMQEAEESLCPAREEWTEENFRVSLARVGRRKFPQAWRAMVVLW